MVIIKDKDLILDIREYDVILIGTNIVNALGNGFQKKIALNFPYVNKINKSTPYDDPRKLGTVKVIPSTDNNPIFCLCYINKGRRRPDLNPDYLDYKALEKCIKLINEHFQGKRIATTLMGNSKFEGDGNYDKILEILENNSSNIDLTIYDYNQKDYQDERRERWKMVKSYSGEEKQRKLKEYAWINAFGELTPLPDNIDEITYPKVKAYIKEKRGH